MSEVTGDPYLVSARLSLRTLELGDHDYSTKWLKSFIFVSR